MIAIREAISPNWAESLCAGKVCFGLDVASTEGKKSNPSSLTATEYWDRIYWQRLVVRWKTEHYAVMLGILEPVSYTHLQKIRSHSWVRRLARPSSNPRWLVQKKPDAN